MSKALSDNTGVPIAWRYSIAVLLGVVISGALGLLLDAQTIGTSIVTGMFLGLVAVLGPFFVALRLILAIGSLMVVTSGLAVIASDHAWLAVLAMVVLVFVGTLWTAVPVAGRLLGTFPGIVYLLILGDSDKFTGGGEAWRVMLAVLVGIVSAVLVLLLLSGRDPRKVTRKMTAETLSTSVTWSQLGSILAILRFDLAPRPLIDLTHSGILAMIARTWLSESGRQDDPAYSQAVAAQNAISATVVPRGPVVPRTVTPPVDQALAALTTAQDSAGTDKEKFAWERWRTALRSGSDVLAGTKKPIHATFSNTSLGKVLIKAALRPESSEFRYGVQKALALGVATFVMVQTQAENFYWVLLTLFSVMQTNVLATFSRSLQYAVGTWIGAVGAVLLGFVLPPGVVAAAAMGLLIAGFAWMMRNYMVMCVAIAAAVVLLVGAPDGDYVQWAGLRALDVTGAVVFALLVSAFVLPVRPQVQDHVKQAQGSLLGAVAQLRDRLGTSENDGSQALSDESDFLMSVANLEADIDMLKDPAGAQGALDELEDANNQVLALASVIFGGQVDDPHLSQSDVESLMRRALDSLDATIRSISVAPTAGTSGS